MNSSLNTLNSIASWIPSKVRGVIYTLIGLFWLVDAIWHFIPDNDTGNKIALTISLVATIMAAINTDLVPFPAQRVSDQEADEAARADAGESTIVTILAVLAIIVLVAVILGWVRL